MLAVAALTVLSACATSSAPDRTARADEGVASRNAGAARPGPTAPGSSAAVAPAAADEPTWGRRFYLDDGPGDRPLVELDSIPDAVPVLEPLNPRTNRPYSVFGRTYTPLDDAKGFRQAGVASWYGRRFHGKPTSSGEPYDMYRMSAAHPTLPIPSYARVTNTANGRSVVVRINDRGPFHPGRIMDLSYAAAHRLGYANRGSAEVRVEVLEPGTLPAPAIAPAVVAAASPPGAPGVAPAAAAVEDIPVTANERMPSAPATAPAAAAPATAVSAPRVVAAATGAVLQVGAFGRRENADALHRSIAEKLPEVAPGLQVVELDGMWRVRVGPLYDQAATNWVRDALRQRMGLGAFPVKP